MSKDNAKMILIVVFDWQGIVHLEFVQSCSTITVAFYVKVMQRSR